MQAPAVTVHHAVLDLSVPVAPEDRAWLDDDERDRLAGFAAPAAARRYAASHAFLRQVLAGHLHVDPEAIVYERWCEHCGHPTHGRPRLAGEAPGVAFSLSHSGDLAVVAVGPGPLGADAEHLGRRPVAAGVVRRISTERERARIPAAGAPGRHRAVLELWTAKEAVAKALGLGVVLPFASFEVAPGAPVSAGPPGGPTLDITHVPVPGAVASVAAPVGAPIVVATARSAQVPSLGA